jgi:N-methylhydantoinase B
MRDKLTQERGEPEMFNFGGTIEEIKSRCLEETHLPAPVSPSFNN